ncbi:Uncharacterised protein [Vibrio cholerae]|nr:Uncharacterised protein [Vibrio cholerae]CSC76542.1 Uncharacterised protein [Vibrio cholerae]CSI49970.1 Uncharacterised protein [Vibrio cholerae]
MRIIEQELKARFHGKVDERGHRVCGNIRTITWKLGNLIIRINKPEFPVRNPLLVECERHVGFIDNRLLFWHKAIIDSLNARIIVRTTRHDSLYRLTRWSTGADEFKETRPLLRYL